MRRIEFQYILRDDIVEVLKGHDVFVPDEIADAVDRLVRLVDEAVEAGGAVPAQPLPQPE